MAFHPAYVRMTGLEPARPSGHIDLNDARIPFRHMRKQDRLRSDHRPRLATVFSRCVCPSFVTGARRVRSQLYGHHIADDWLSVS